MAGDEPDETGSETSGDGIPEESTLLPPGSAARPSKRDRRPPTLSPPYRPPKPKRKRWQKIFWVIPLLLVAWITYLVVVPVIAFGRITQTDYAPPAHRPADQPGTTTLIVGSDARKGLSGSRTDTIMLMHTGIGPTVLLSIPRDSLVTIPGHGTSKINAAYSWGGPQLLVQTIEKDTGIRIDGYVEIGFGGFKDVIDSLGGIEICPTQRIVDKYAHLDIAKGCQLVDGTTALAYSRSRHSQKLGDIGREEHQREVVATVGSDVFSPSTFLDPKRYQQVAFGIADSITLGKGMSILDAAKLARALSRIGVAGMTCTVPIADLDVHWDTARANKLFTYIKQDRTAVLPKSLCTASGFPPSTTQ